MSEDEPQAIDDAPEASPRSRKCWRAVGMLGIVLALILLTGWCSREQIVNRIVAGQLERLDLPGTYTVEKVSANRQILTNVVIGDSAHPDLVAERIEVETRLGLGMPTLSRITLIRPRLHGTLKGGKLSFGVLDKAIYAKRGGPAGLPDLDLTLIDGRARIDSSYGTVGMSADGTGNLRGGFNGTVAALAPQLLVGNCTAHHVSAFGKLTTRAAVPAFDGPLRLAALDCKGGRASLRRANLMLTAQLSPEFTKVKGRYALDSGAVSWQDSRLGSLVGKGEYSFADGNLLGRYTLDGHQLAVAGVQMGKIRLDGDLRGHNRFARWDARGAIGGQGIKPGRDFDRALAGMAGAGQGTLLEPLAQQLRVAVRREVPGSSLAATYQLSQTGGVTTLVVPGMLWRGSTGARLAQLSQAELGLNHHGGLRIAGSISIQGAGLPRIEGQFERNGSGGTAQLSLAEYRAGDSRVALPRLKLVQRASGVIGFAGEAQVSGSLPGGRIDNLRLPVEGNWSNRGGLAVLRKCTPVRFDRFKIANLSLNAQILTLCPGKEGAIVKLDRRGFRASAGATALSFTGTLGTTAIRLKSGAIGVAWPGALAARDIDVSLGWLDHPNTLKIANLKARLGQEVVGTFAGTALKLDAVPIDVYDAAGNWRFAGGDLAISEASLWVKDREKLARFKPLNARDAALQLHSTTFTAQALLREPASDRVIVDTRIAHDLDTLLGHADLLVPGIRFDKQLQPDMLTDYTLGVIADVRGVVAGQGRIDWNRNGVTSTGEFETSDADFGALFGPVKGVSGTVHFTDLLGLVTAPQQHLSVRSINPGIEVNDGDVTFQLEPGNVLHVIGAEWPFIDGRLTLLPTRMVLGAAETRRFTVKVEGINAAKFVQRLELGNLSATGIFDGTLPLVFDQKGGQIESGLLISRPPGGNISYIGELTYKDLSAMGNFVFQALKSLDFSRMEIALSGHIDGEIVSQIKIDGVRQGPGGKRNVLTHQIAKLPIKLNVNIRAPFYQLVTSLKSTYDPAYVRDPRAIGLIPADGKPPKPSPAPGPGSPAALAPPLPPAQRPHAIQPPESRIGP